MNRLFAGALSLLAFMATPALAGVVKNISTGIDAATGLQIPNNALDTNYVIASGGSETAYVGQNPIARSTPLPATYMPDSASSASRWIAVNSGSGLEGISVPAGTFNFQTTVDLTGFDPATAAISNARFSVDDALNWVEVNGTIVDTPTSGIFDQFYDLPTSMGSGAFVAGVNTITFQVDNGVSGTPEAFRLEADVTATPVPEPAMLWLLGIPLLVTGLQRKRRSAYNYT